METITNMTVKDIIEGSIGIVLLLSVFFEITPIKFNPISLIMKWIGKKANVDVFDKVNALENGVINLKDNISLIEGSIEGIRSDREFDKAMNCKVRILQFGDDLRMNIRHSQEHFNQILEDIDEYERYCNRHPDFKNNKTVTTTKKILETYEKCVDQNDFL